MYIVTQLTVKNIVVGRGSPIKYTADAIKVVHRQPVKIKSRIVFESKRRYQSRYCGLLHIIAQVIMLDSLAVVIANSLSRPQRFPDTFPSLDIRELARIIPASRSNPRH
jgi:hypothetical protein